MATNTTIAAVQTAFEEPLVVDELQLPDPRPDQVRVKLLSSGVCHSQLHQMHNPDGPRPGLLGHEGTGIVTDVGSGVTHLEEGDKCIVTWVPRTKVDRALMAQPTGATFRGEPALGAVYTWSNDVLTSGSLVVPIPDDHPDDVSCIVGCAVLTGAGAVLNTAKVRAGESVAVFGVGGVGLCAIQAAALVSAYPIIAVDLSEDKLEFARSFGATHTVNAGGNTDPVEEIKAITNGGVDYAFDAIGVRQTAEQILPATRAGSSGAGNEGGTAVLIGIPPKEITLDPRMFMMTHRQYRGSLGATYPDTDFPMFLRWHKEGKFPLDKLITRRYKLKEINDACNDLHGGKILGRAILEY
jgi:Zn-dependent alcohol dehydrogenase